MRIALAMVLVLVLAGCSGPRDAPAKAAATEPQPPDSLIEVGEGTARVDGRTVDPEFRPVADVDVQILGRSANEALGLAPLDLMATERVGRSDAEGGFAFNGLAPGTYAVSVARTGYLAPPPRSFKVHEDETYALTLVLEALAPPSPFHESINRKSVFSAICTPSLVFNPQCVPLSNRNQNTRNPSDPTPYTSRTNFTVKETTFVTLQTIVMEAFLVEATPACRIGVAFLVWSPDSPADLRDGSNYDPDRQGRYAFDSRPNVTTPVNYRINRDGDGADAIHSAERVERNEDDRLKTNGNWTASWSEAYVGSLGTPADVSCAIDQKVDVWASTFYVQVAPAGWSIKATA